MSNQQGVNPQPATGYQVGDVVNGHVFTGAAWVPVAQRTSQAGSPAAGLRHAEPNQFATPVSAPVKQGMATSTKVALAVLGLVVGVFGLGLAAAIAIPVFLNSSMKGYEAAVQSDLRDAATAAETHWTTNGIPPVDAQVLDDFGWAPGTGVTIMLAASGPEGYCLEGTHANLPGKVWRYDSGTGLAEASCF